MSLRLQRIDNQPAEGNQDSSMEIIGIVQATNGTPIPGSALTSATMDLWDLDTLTPIRSESDIRSMIDTDGRLSLMLHPEDGALITEGEAGTKERHILRIEYTWAAHPEGQKQQIEIDVERLHPVPA